MNLSLFEKEILMCHALGIDHARLISHPELFDEKNTKYLSYKKRRLKHEPVAYITGFQPFMGLKIFVGRSVLIPRPETEELVEKAIDIIKQNTVHGKRYTVHDIGTGSGAIAIVLTKNLPNIKVIGIDSSPKAIKIAKKNAKYHKVSKRCKFVIGDLLDTINIKADMIISNPPYIPTDQIKNLMPDVKDWEPHSALNGGRDGLKYIKEIIKTAPKYLKKEGVLLLEFGINQSKEIKKAAGNYFSKVNILNDLSEKERFLIGTS